MPPVLPLLVLLSAASGLGSYVWPNHLYEELEHLLVDQEGFNRGGYFKRAITPCTHYVNGDQTLGRMSAAQWLRTAFHDYATANIHDGTGGVDASIGWETDRPENVGSAFNDSMSFFAPFVNKHVSMADMIALSVVTSVGVCSSPNIHIPFRGGRIDASEGGTFGVPEPETDIDTTLAQFAQTGFNQKDAIGLTACGHTLGNVHHGGFPQVVGPEAVMPNNTGGGVHFDSTVDIFDVFVASEYLDGVGQRGGMSQHSPAVSVRSLTIHGFKLEGPLVTTANVTVRSDLRIYMSDNNATMKDLSTSQEYFVAQCVSLFTRMLETVPSRTTLSDVISPLEVKPINVTLALMDDIHGARLLFSGFIRLLSTNFTENAKVSLSWIARDGHSAAAYVAAAKYVPTQGSGMFGDTYFHAFNISIDPSKGISAFKVVIREIDGQGSTTFDNNGRGYGIQDRAFVMNNESTVDGEGLVKITAVVLTESSALAVSNVSAVLSYPTPQIGTMSPKISSQSSILQLDNSSQILAKSGYVKYTGLIQLPLDSFSKYQLSVDLTVLFGEGVEDNEVVKDTFKRLKIQRSEEIDALVAGSLTERASSWTPGDSAILLTCSLLPGEMFVFLEHCQNWKTVLHTYGNSGFQPDLETVTKALPPPSFLIGLEEYNVWFEATLQTTASSTTSVHMQIAVKGEDISRSQQERWQSVVKEKVGEIRESELYMRRYPMYELLSLHLLPMLHEEANSSPKTQTLEDVSLDQSLSSKRSSSGTVYHALFTSHHLVSPTKRRNLQQWSSSLSISGFAKVGHPGVIYAEGTQEDVQEFIDNVKAMQWLALRLRFMERIPDEGAGYGYSKRQWTEFQKVGEVVGEMGRIGRESFVVEMGIGSRG
ncbi:hypothetical protein D9757_010957 [Collybiopsis confluens]|uniref:Peroxidase n=1 Tax=Collybiopsis confluens TaxID=2823264 RepID=A0A8H5GJK6_9AGAR|nr:hypothetical protein D9757_010957 [Collybiopsis confluens]